MKKTILLIITFCSIIFLGLMMSWKSIPDQEGYFEISWNISHQNFSKGILSPGIVPLNYLGVMFIEKLFHLSLVNSWKIWDLFFGGLLGIFLVKICWKFQKPINIISQIIPVLIIITSFGYIYSLTSMTGEGASVFFAVVGTYFWHKNKYFKASIFLCVSYLSKNTVYLIGPGLFLWTMFNIPKKQKSEINKIIVSGFIFLSVFLLYNLIKNWSDITLQAAYSHFSIPVIFQNLPPFILSLFIGAPIVILFFFLYPSFTNFYFILIISGLIMLCTRYFNWHYPFQLIPFFILYYFTNTNYYKINNYLGLILLQIFIFISLFKLIPLSSNLGMIYPKPLSQTESKTIDQYILNDYHGGKIGYYMNRRFDEPFPNYEISYMDPNWNFIIENTEYVVVPIGGLPQQILNFKQCRYEFYKHVNFTNIFKVICDSNKFKTKL